MEPLMNPDPMARSSTLRGRWLLGLAVGALAALLLLPATRWIVVEQFREQVYPGRLDLDAGGAAVAARHPDDIPVQLALAARASTVEPIRALRTRFPNSPALCSAALRWETLPPGFQWHLPWTDGQRLMGVRVQREVPAPSPEILERIREAAAAGEKLDPDNAYFTMMRAVGLMAGHADAEAWGAVRLASRKPVWNEYFTDEVYGQWKIDAEASGHVDGGLRVLRTETVPLPQDPALLVLTRVLVYRAVRAEAAGRVDEGLEIRHALMRCAGRMRAQSTRLIDTIVAMSITREAMQRAGGTGPRQYLSLQIGNRNIPLLTERYLAYLEKIGKPAEARWARAELANVEEADALWQQSINSAWYGLSLWEISYWWLAGALVLMVSMWMLGLGITATALAHTRRMGEGRPLSTETRRGIGAGLVLAGLLGLGGMRLWEAYATTAVFAGGCVLVALLAYGTLLKRPAALRAAGVILSTLATILVAVGGGVLFCAQLGGLSARVQWMATRLSGVAPPAASWEQLMQFAAGAVAVLPALYVLVLTGCSVAWKLPVSVGLVRGFRGALLPTLCALTLAYGGVVIGTARVEARAVRVMEQVVRHEGRYLAQWAGRQWPGPP